MCADLAFRHTDSLDKGFYLVEFQGCQAQSASNLVYHTIIFWRIGLGILVELSLVVALEILDNLSGDEFHIALRRCEADERTAVYERRTSDAHVTLLQSCLIEQHVYVVAQLRAANY